MTASTHGKLARNGIARQTRRLFGSTGTSMKTGVLSAAKRGPGGDIDPELASQELYLVLLSAPKTLLAYKL